jgi:hypothetical protein
MSAELVVLHQQTVHYCVVTAAGSVAADVTAVQRGVWQHTVSVVYHDSWQLWCPAAVAASTLQAATAAASGRAHM